MKIGDIIQKIAEIVTAVENPEVNDPGAPDPKIQNPAELTPIIVQQDSVEVVGDEPGPNGTTNAGNDKAPDDVFLPPLQQKQELLKKAVGVENIYDDGGPVEQEQEAQEQAQEDTSQRQDDIVTRIKRLSGIPTAAVQELSNDDVVDD